MATITALNRPNGQNRGGLYSAINYVMQDKKTAWNGEKLVTGQNCIPQFAFNEMIATKHQWNKAARFRISVTRCVKRIILMFSFR